MSSNRKAKLDSLVKSIPVGARNVSIVMVGVSVSQESLDANLDLALDRAKGITEYLKNRGIDGNYTVSVYTNFTVDSGKPTARAGEAGSPSIAFLGVPAKSRTVKPLSTARISFAARRHLSCLALNRW